MKKLYLLTAAFLSACILTAGCGLAEDTPAIQTIESQTVESSEQESTQEVSEEPSEEVKESLIIEERFEKDGKMQSYLTGEWKDTSVVNRRSMAVMVGNNSQLLPQYGISLASIIYEAPVEGRISRLMLFIEDYDDLERVGPVRSSRDYFVYEAMAYDAIYCNWGLAVPYVEELLASNRIDNISQALAGIHNPSSEAFDRVSRPGYATEYTGYMFIDGYNAAVERHGYEPEYRDSFEQAFTFANDGHTAAYESYEDATMIYPGGSESNKGGYGSHKPWFDYNEEDGLYYRYQFNEEHIDEMNGEQVAVRNVIFKICHGEVRDQNDYLAFGVHGEGKAVIFTNGKVIEGVWKRPSDSAANMFYDENGNEIVFNQGKTWICNIWEEYAEYAEWK
jgi:hypothetical protein